MTAPDASVYERPAAIEDVTLIVPTTDVPDPELSIVIPALDEEITIGRFVDWCKEGIAAVGIQAEILIIDSSNDRTAEIAVAHGARVLKTPKRGLGRAYIDAIPYIRGRYVLMGDADCTYDFRELHAFIDKFRAGFEFIMGSRFAGSIDSTIGIRPTARVSIWSCGGGNDGNWSRSPAVSTGCHISRCAKSMRLLVHPRTFAGKISNLQPSMRSAVF